MAPRDRDGFDSKRQDASAAGSGYVAPMINRTMGAGEWAGLLLLALLWGGAFFFIDVAVAEVDPLTFVWLRLSLAAAALWLYLALRGQLPALPVSVVGSMIVLALLNNAIPFTLFAWGQTHIGGGLSSILNATSPIWAVLIAHVATSDERMSSGKLAGVLLGFAGVVVMIGPAFFTGGHALAQIACLSGALSYALAGVWARRFRAMGIGPTSIAAWQLALAAAMMLPVALFADRPWNAAMPSAGAWAAILALAIFCSAFAYVIYFRIIERAGATNALLVTLLTPPVAILLTALFLDEQLAPQHIAGLAFIAVGLATIDGRLFSGLRRSAFQRGA